MNVLNQVKAVPEVCTIYCATANPVQLLVAVTDAAAASRRDRRSAAARRRDRADVADRKDLLRAIGYKL